MAAETDSSRRPCAAVGRKAPSFCLFDAPPRSVPYRLADCLTDEAALLAFVPHSPETLPFPVRDLGWFEFIDGLQPVVVSDVHPDERPPFADQLGTDTLVLGDPTGKVAATYGVRFGTDPPDGTPRSAVFLVDDAGIVREECSDPEAADIRRIAETCNRLAEPYNQ